LLLLFIGRLLRNALDPERFISDAANFTQNIEKINMMKSLAPLPFCQKLRGSDTSEPREGRGDSGAPSPRPIQAFFPKQWFKVKGSKPNSLLALSLDFY
jgi:hypothetical protein